MDGIHHSRAGTLILLYLFSQVSIFRHLEQTLSDPRKYHWQRYQNACQCSKTQQMATVISQGSGQKMGSLPPSMTSVTSHQQRSVPCQLAAGLHESLFISVRLGFSNEVKGIIVFWNPINLLESEPHHLVAVWPWAQDLNTWVSVFSTAERGKYAHVAEDTHVSCDTTHPDDRGLPDHSVVVVFARASQGSGACSRGPIKVCSSVPRTTYSYPRPGLSIRHVSGPELGTGEVSKDGEGHHWPQRCQSQESPRQTQCDSVPQKAVWDGEAWRKGFERRKHWGSWPTKAWQEEVCLNWTHEWKVQQTDRGVELENSSSPPQPQVPQMQAFHFSKALDHQVLMP